MIQPAPSGTFAASDPQARSSDLHTDHRSADSQNTAVQTPAQQPSGGGPLPDPSPFLAHTMSVKSV